MKTASAAHKGAGHPVCSPRTRGWSPALHVRRVSTRVLPAHAGMVPTSRSYGVCRSRAPRARGDGPFKADVHKWTGACSPRTRGWPRPAPAMCRPGSVLPAHAGMAPRDDVAPTLHASAPRARGDGPSAGSGVLRRCACSPRTRGPGVAHAAWLGGPDEGWIGSINASHGRWSGVCSACWRTRWWGSRQGSPVRSLALVPGCEEHYRGERDPGGSR